MKIIIKDKNNIYVKTFLLTNLENIQILFAEFSAFKGPLDTYIFAKDEVLNSFFLTEFKKNIEILSLGSLKIYSNIRETILTGKSLKLDSTFLNESELKNKLSLVTFQKEGDILHKGTVRSGDRISSKGDLVIIGDVNPGAIVSAKKNVYVWGKLLGIALAGEGGNQNASISSLYLNPLQLRISNIVAVGPKEKPKNYYPEIAMLEEKSIVIKPFLVES